ncbi:MAG TPA: S9 family peptidase [Ignavibacteriaceae bacterium]|nr:S9 family peptidase [Ignavibacteriaceae bacterium]
MKTIFANTFFIIIILSTIVFPQKSAFTISDLYKIRNVGAPVISYDGKMIAFTITDNDLPKGTSTTKISVMNEDGSNLKSIPDTSKNIYEPVWTKTGDLDYIAVKNGTPQLFQYSFTDNKTIQLTNLSTGVDAPVVSPDGNLVAFSTDVYPSCGANDNCDKEIDSTSAHGPIQAYLADHLLFRHWTQYSAGKYTHIFIYNVENKTYTDVTPGKFVSPTFMLGGGVGYNFSPDSKQLCFVSNHDPHPEASTNADLWIVPVTGGDAINITKGNKAWDGWPIYSPDGRYIAYRTQLVPGYESDRFRLAIYDRQTKKSRILTDSFDNWVDDFRWSPDSKEIYFMGEVEGYEPIYKVDLASDKITNITGNQAISGFEIANEGKDIVFAASSVAKPRELYRINLGDRKIEQITDFNKKFLEDVDVRPVEKMWVEGTGGKKVEVFIVKPHDFDPNKKYPLILNVHGGPQMQWMDSFRGDWQVYPGSGYVVAFPNPHGSTGYGEAYTAEISGDWGGKVFEDLMKVTDALEKLPYVDKNKMGAMGWSYGGYMMDWFQAKTKRFKCLASMMGVYDLTSMWGSTEELWFVNHELNGQPWNSEDYTKFSPSHYAKNFSTPTLIFTGQKDFRVPYNQSIEYFTTLQTLGVPSRLIIFKNDGHWPDNIKSMPLYYDAHLDWFHKYLGGLPAPYNVKEMIRNLSFKNNSK